MITKNKDLKSYGKLKPNVLLTIGISTYNRSEHLIDRLSDFQKHGYIKNPEIEIIVHDNDSENKLHFQFVEQIQKNHANIFLIKSSPNIGFVRGVEKILLAARGKWIVLLGDDDPIILNCAHFLKLIKKNTKSDHLYFRTMEYENGQPRKVSWFPKLKAGNYSPSELCAKTGFTTHFAHLAAHSFRNKKNLPKLWLKSHQKSTFYGHCIMLIENYKSSFYSGKTVAAWRSGNERVSSELNIIMNMEIRKLFKFPPTKAIRNFIQLTPQNVRREGTFPFQNQSKDRELEFFERNESLSKKERIILQEVRPMQFNPNNHVCIYPTGKYKSANLSCVFYQKDGNTKKKHFNNAAVVYMCGPSARLESICNIVRKMELTGTILLHDKAVSPLMLLAGYCNAGIRKKIWKIQAYAIVSFSVLMYGVEEFNVPRIILNYFKRPQKGFYGLIRFLERVCRINLKKMLSSRNEKDA
jgi:glycosyltransferase involved in cell wall biosynthesis